MDNKNIEISNLTNLSEGDSAVVTDLTITGSMRRRLQDIGLVKGTYVKCIQKSPLGDPSAYLIRGAVIALRTEDASGVLVNN